MSRALIAFPRIDHDVEESSMADQPSAPDDNRPAADRGPTANSPRWWKVFVIVAIIVVVLFTILLLTGGHGPGRHTSSGWSTDRGPASGVVVAR
jgi:hypothetical protein